MTISETKGLGWTSIRTLWRKASDMLTSSRPPFVLRPPKIGKGIGRLI